VPFFFNSKTLFAIFGLWFKGNKIEHKITLTNEKILFHDFLHVNPDPGFVCPVAVELRHQGKNGFLPGQQIH
jgi:hypothetical protein